MIPFCEAEWPLYEITSDFEEGDHSTVSDTGQHSTFTQTGPFTAVALEPGAPDATRRPLARSSSRTATTEIEEPPLSADVWIAAPNLAG